jgi:hypothetical protein
MFVVQKPCLQTEYRKRTFALNSSFIIIECFPVHLFIATLKFAELFGEPNETFTEILSENINIFSSETVAAQKDIALLPDDVILKGLIVKKKAASSLRSKSL